MRCIFRLVFPPIAALWLCCAWSVPIAGAERDSSYQAALDSIQAGAIADQVGRLADPAMEGREAGTRGGLAAGQYLAEQYAHLHLHGAGDEGSLFQPFAPNFRNILTILKGNDPQLRDQVIIVGAHYDHIGYGAGGRSRGGYGYVHPGADDNASGSAAVLELAQAFTILSAAPRRSIVFAAWDAEEMGLLGSKYWVAHPTLPLEHVVAMINLDMVGRLRDEHLIVYGSRTGYGWRRFVSSQNDGSLQLDFTWTFKPNNDCYPFFERGVPVLMLHTGLHDDYHRPADVAKLINCEGMTELTRLLFRLVYDLADRSAAVPGFREAARHETPQTEQAVLEQAVKPADRLGVEWIDDAAMVGGIRISSVEPDSPAARAGLRPGDRIRRFAGREIRSNDDFFAAVSSADSPASLTIERQGEKKPLELKVSLAGSPLQWGIAWRVDDAEPGTIILTCVVPGSPAAWAGLKPGDRIYQVAGRDFADEAAFAHLVTALADSLQLLVERGGHLRTVIVQRRQAEPIKRAA